MKTLSGCDSASTNDGNFLCISSDGSNNNKESSHNVVIFIYCFASRLKEVFKNVHAEYEDSRRDSRNGNDFSIGARRTDLTRAELLIMSLWLTVAFHDESLPTTGTLQRSSYALLRIFIPHFAAFHSFLNLTCGWPLEGFFARRHSPLSTDSYISVSRVEQS